MDPKMLQAALDALIAGDNEACAELLKKLITGGSVDAAPAGTTPTTEAAATEQKEYAALAREIMTLSATDTVGAALPWLRRLAADRAALESDRAALESGERRALVTELVTLKAETPATAWERNDKGEIPEGDARRPCKRLSAESLADLRVRVAALRPAQPSGNGGHQPPPVAGAGGAVDESRLSDYERKAAAGIKDPEKRKQFVEVRLSRLAPVPA